MGCMMGFAIDTRASRMNKGGSEDAASARQPISAIRLGHVAALPACVVATTVGGAVPWLKIALPSLHR